MNQEIHELNDAERAFVLSLMERTRSAARRHMAIKLGDFRASALEDCEAELWLLVCTEVQKLMKHEKPDGWVYIAAGNIALNMQKALIRRENAETHGEPAEEVTSDELPPEDRVINDLIYERWKNEGFKEKLLEGLTEAERKIYRLRYIEKRSFAEIAAVTGRSSDAVQMALSRIRKKIISEVRRGRC